MLNNDHESFAAAQARAAAAVSCESVVLPSGLTVLCRTMPGYSSVHAIYATGFGSVHRAFRLDGKQVTLPAGTAHGVGYYLHQAACRASVNHVCPAAAYFAAQSLRRSDIFGIDVGVRGTENPNSLHVTHLLLLLRFLCVLLLAIRPLQRRNAPAQRRRNSLHIPR